MKVEIYSDVACPWCYVGKARFERALGAFSPADAVEVVYRPYQLDPGAPAPGVPMMRYLEGRFGAAARAMADRVTENGRTEGLVMDYETGIAANTFDAHRLMRLAEREHGAATQRALAEKLFEAHFSDGRDISDPDVLLAIGVAAGLDPERVRAYLASDEGRDELRAELDQARGLGISAVPTFVFDGRFAVQGAQPTSAFLQALETVARETRGATGEPEADRDACADGACTI